MEYGIGFVCLFGIATVFLSLVTIVLLTLLMSAVLGKSEPQKQDSPAAAPAPASAPAPAPVDNGIRPEVIAAITAAIAADMGASFNNAVITAIRRAE